MHLTVPRCRALWLRTISAGNLIHLSHVVEMPVIDIMIGADEMPVTCISPDAGCKDTRCHLGHYLLLERVSQLAKSVK